MNRRHRFVAAAGAALLAASLGAALPSAAGAKEDPPVTLTKVSQTHLWSGEFVAGALGAWLTTVSLPEACTPEVCDIVPLEVQLPEKSWQQRPGGMLVAIQTPVLDTFGYDLDLFVYAPDGSQAASSASSPIANEAAWIPDPVNGTYTVVVVPKFVVSQPLVDEILEPLAYDGFVRFDRGVTVRREELNNGEPFTREFVAFGLTERRRPVELLPDLVPTTPRNFHIETAVGAGLYSFTDRGLRHQPSCYPEETLGVTDDEPNPGAGPLKCLRFDQGEHNVGDGPLQLNVYEGSTDVYQRIYSSDGRVDQTEPVGEVEFNELHGHFHFQGFQEVTFHRIEEDGSLTFVKEKPDKGICMADIEMSSFGRTDRPTSPLGYPSVTRTCVGFTHQDRNDPTFPDRPYFEMGIAVGWADYYPWFIADQYIDITGVDDGKYAIVVRQDVDNRILEKSTKNNTAMGCVEIEGDEAEEISCQ